MPKKETKTDVVSMKVTPSLSARLNRAAERSGIPKAALAQQAIEAAIDAIERNNYRLVVPIEFEVTHIPLKTSAGKAEAPATEGERPVARAGGRSSGSTAERLTYSTNETPAPRTTEDAPSGPAPRK